MKDKGERAARRILQQVGDRFPVDVLAIAEAYNITVTLQELEETVSGALIIQDGQAIMGVNRDHHPSRQRFTVAHELAHYILHRNVASVFIDGASVFYRDTRSAEGRKLQEIEANAFAAELLMPEQALRKELDDQSVDPFDEAKLKQLAERFDVSVQALTIRLTRLNLLTY